MPGLSGTEALDEKAIDDSVPVVGTSSFKPGGARPVGGAIAGIIYKPYALESFSEVLLAVRAAG